MHLSLKKKLNYKSWCHVKVTQKFILFILSLQFDNSFSKILITIPLIEAELRKVVQRKYNMAWEVGKKRRRGLLN
jgi:hypothetical protein